jgi:cytoskeletal protein CcmA (bactofilin family)
MFRKSKHKPMKDNQVPSPVEQVQMPVAASDTPEPMGETSSISSEITIVGKITGKGTVKISGRIEGELHASIVLIADGAEIEGDIVATEVTIGGRVRGSVHADRVKLTSSAVVEGDICHKSLSIEENAHFEGSSRRQEVEGGIDALPVPLNRRVAQTEDTVAAMQGSRKHNGPIETKWDATE